MEGKFIWNTWCESKNYPSNFISLQKLYPKLSQEELDGILEDQIHEFEIDILKIKFRN